MVQISYFIEDKQFLAACNYVIKILTAQTLNFMRIMVDQAQNMAQEIANYKKKENTMEVVTDINIIKTFTLKIQFFPRMKLLKNQDVATIWMPKTSTEIHAQDTQTNLSTVELLTTIPSLLKQNAASVEAKRIP